MVRAQRVSQLDADGAAGERGEHLTTGLVGGPVATALVKKSGRVMTGLKRFCSSLMESVKCFCLSS